MSLLVLKRDGSEVSFDLARIQAAACKALMAAGSRDAKAADLADDVARRVKRRMPVDGSITVEEIQDYVQLVLMQEGQYEAATKFIVYRAQRAATREIGLLFVNVENIIEGYLGGSDWRIKENANTNFSLQGLNNFLAGALSTRYWLYLMDEDISRAHTSAEIHIHDLGILAPYCCGWDLYQLLEEGFRGAPDKIECAPPKHFRTALGQLINFIFTLQGEAAGAQAISSFDTLLAPFVREDGLSYDKVKQAIQEFVYNANVPTRVGFQSPFFNLTLDVVPPTTYANEPVMVGGKLLDYTYGTCQDEMNLINRAFCEVLIEGDASGRPFTYPIPTYNIWKGTDWEDDEKWGHVWAMAAELGLPYFANFMNSDMNPEDVRSMCCRLRLDYRELEKRVGGLFGSAPLTGSIGVVTVNLANAAIRAEHNETVYWANIDEAIRKAAASLVAKAKIIEDKTSHGLYPYSKFYLRGVKERLGRYWAQHFCTIGLIGAHEAALELLGVGIDTPAGHDLAERTLRFFVDRSKQLSEQYGMAFNIEATPGEGAGYRLARQDAKNYPNSVIAKTACITARGEHSVLPYTNSTQLPVNTELDLVDALQHQDVLQPIFTGGTVFHIFIGQALPSPAHARTFVRYVCENFHLPYVTLSPIFSICPVHGRFTGRHDTCPVCKEECEVWDRVVGFYRPLRSWNTGKAEEFERRTRFDSALSEGV